MGKKLKKKKMRRKKRRGEVGHPIKEVY